jgi:hypothetical protein
VRTVRLKVVVFVTPPPLALTVILDVAGGVAALAVMVKVVEQVAAQEGEEKAAVAPAGRPETVNETSWALPEVKAAVIELLTDDPAVTVLFPALAKEKAKGCVIVKEALASPLAVCPSLKAFALSCVLLVRSMGPL